MTSPCYQRRLVPNVPLSNIKTRVYAANGTLIPVMGTVTLRFEVADVPVHCKFLVSDAVDEPMLGIDWLTANNCHWDFTRGILMIKGQEVSLLERPRRPTVRRVYVEESVFVPPLTQVTVPVRLAWTNYEKSANATEWMLDTKQLYQGVVVARSLLPEVGTKTFVRAVNLSDQPRTLSVGMCIGSAEPVQVVGGVTPAANPAAVLGELSCQSGGTPALPLMREWRDGNRPTYAVAPPHPTTCGPTNGTSGHPRVTTEGFNQKLFQCESSDYSHVQPVLEGFVGKLSECEFSTAKWLVYDLSLIHISEPTRPY